MRSWYCAAFASLLTLAAAKGAASQQHPQDLLETPWIKSAWTKALAGERFAREDSWIPGFGGVSSAPVPQRDASGRQWTVATLCQPRNCSDNKLVVLIDPSARTIWALQKTVGPARERFFGAPDPATQGLLRAALSGNLAAVSPSTQTAAPAAAAAETGTLGANGTIEGEFSYPSDYIPADLQACAEETQSKRLTCSSRKIRQGDRRRYVLALPPGDYFVFAQTKDSPGRRAYYSEFVACGLNAACKSHKPIVVSVTPGGSRKDVNPQDWYAR